MEKDPKAVIGIRSTNKRPVGSIEQCLLVVMVVATDDCLSHLFAIFPIKCVSACPQRAREWQWHMPQASQSQRR